jgi:hypothetical protein
MLNSGALPSDVLRHLRAAGQLLREEFPLVMGDVPSDQPKVLVLLGVVTELRSDADLLLARLQGHGPDGDDFLEAELLLDFFGVVERRLAMLMAVE